MQIRIFIIAFLAICATTNAQVFQTNNTPINFARGLKARDLFIAPKGCDTTALSNPKWGESTAGALFVDTCNNRLYFFDGVRWQQSSDTNFIRNQFAIQEQKKFSVIQGKVDALDFNTTSAIADSTQRLTWDNGNGTLNIGLKGGAVNLAVGQEQVARVFNESGSNLVDGELVYITGAQGNRVAVSKASNANAAVAFATIGMATEPIANGAEGFITILGTVNKLNTAAIPEGTELWLGATAGTYTTTKPTYPASIVSIGHVERSHATVGSIYVNIRPELPTVASYGKNAAGDSTILLLTNGQRFAAEDSTGGGGVTTLAEIGSTPNANGATISGNTLNLQPASTSFGGVVTTGSQSFTGQKFFTGLTSLDSAVVFKGGPVNTGTGMYFASFNNAVNNKQVFVGDRDYIGNTARNYVRFFSTNGYTYLSAVNGANTANAPLQLGGVGSAGAVHIGPDASVTDAGAKLWVNGSASIGSGIKATTAPTNGLLVQGDVNLNGQLSLNSTTRGAILNRLTATQRNAIGSPTAGEFLYDSDSGRVMLRTASAWRGLAFTGESNSNNIYTTDGTLGANRTVTIADKTLTFSGTSTFTGTTTSIIGPNLIQLESGNEINFMSRTCCSNSGFYFRDSRLSKSDVQFYIGANNIGDIDNGAITFRNSQASSTASKFILAQGGSSTAAVAYEGRAQAIEVLASNRASVSHIIGNIGHSIGAGFSSPLVSSFAIKRPSITLGSGASVSLGASLYVDSATSSATDNYALYVNQGASKFNQQVIVGNATPNASAALEVSSTTQGFLPPRMTAAEANAIVDKAEGLMVYVTNTGGSPFNFTGKGWWGWNGSTWEKLNN